MQGGAGVLAQAGFAGAEENLVGQADGEAGAIQEDGGVFRAEDGGEFFPHGAGGFLTLAITQEAGGAFLFEGEAGLFRGGEAGFFVLEEGAAFFDGFAELIGLALQGAVDIAQVTKFIRYEGVLAEVMLGAEEGSDGEEGAEEGKNDEAEGEAARGGGGSGWGREGRRRC